MSNSYDFLVIGGGSAGYAAARTAASHGLHTAVVEGGEDIGGLCILRGCMPSKALLESGHRAEAIRKADKFGLHASFKGADGKVIRDRKRMLIGEFASYRREQLESGRFAFLRGDARFVDDHTIELAARDGSTQRIEAKSILIATGSVISVPAIPGLKDAGYLTSDDVLDSAALPSSVCVLGGGAIALELASYYQGLGIPTTVIQRSKQVLREMDADVAEELVRGLRARGITVHLGTKLEKVSKLNGAKQVHFSGESGSSQTVTVEEIVCALGRTPATASLNWEKAGVVLEKSHIATEATQQTSVPHIFAAGDVCGPHEVVHIAIQQGEIAARNAARLQGRASGPLEKIDYRLKLFAVFTQPEAAAVGLSEAEAKETGLDFRVAKYPFADHGKSMIKDELHGFVKLIAERTSGRLIGGSCVGPEASELIHEIVAAMRFNATAADLATTPHYHPTLSEIWTYPAEELAETQ